MPDNQNLINEILLINEFYLNAFALRRTENGKRKTENGERKTENGERKTENGERRTENGTQLRFRPFRAKTNDCFMTMGRCPTLLINRAIALF